MKELLKEWGLDMARRLWVRCGKALFPLVLVKYDEDRRDIRWVHAKNKQSNLFNDNDKEE